MIKKELLLISVTEKLDSLSSPQLEEVSKFLDRLNNNDDADFETFWQMWKDVAGIKNQTKAKTKPALNRALKKVDLETILTAIKEQNTWRKEQEGLGEFTPCWKHATTWLNQEGWTMETEMMDWSNKEKAIEAVKKNPNLESEFRKHNNKAYNEYLLTKM